MLDICRLLPPSVGFDQKIRVSPTFAVIISAIRQLVNISRDNLLTDRKNHGNMPFKRGDEMSFSEQLKMARLRKRMTQQEVAEAMCITKSTYCGYETGKRRPDVEKLKRLAEILETSVDWLLEMSPAVTAAETSNMQNTSANSEDGTGRATVPGKAKITIVGSQGEEELFISHEVNEKDAEMIRRVIRSANRDRKKSP